MTALTDFLANNVQGYLFHDLRAMQATVAPPGTPGGSLGYPLLMATFAGIELLGALLSPTAFDTDSGATYFKRYWSDVLYPSRAASNEIDIVYRLARHGIAHTFLPKGALGIVKGQPTYHLVHGQSGEFYVDASQLAADLIESYELRVRPFLSTPNVLVDAARMGSRLAEMTIKYTKQAGSLVSASNTSGYIGSTSGPVGPSGPIGPISSSVSRSAPGLTGGSLGP